MVELVYMGTVYWQRSGEKEDRMQDVEMKETEETGDVRTGWCEATCPDLPQGSEPTRITAGPRPNPAVRGPGDQARQACGCGMAPSARTTLTKFRALLKVPGLVSSPFTTRVKN